MASTGRTDLYATVAQGRLRELYLGAMSRTREALGSTELLRSWDDWASDHPRATRTHLRTLLSVHNAEDLVQFDMPWWTYQAVDRVSGYLMGLGGSARIFEYGAGASTIWFARRAGSVVSVEHHPGWAERVRAMAAEAGLDNVEVVVPEVPVVDAPRVPSGAPSGAGLDFEQYVGVLAEREGPWDLVAVDGRAREACLREARDHVGPNGLILFDDAQRSRYQDVLAESRSTGWVLERNRGASPCDPLPRETALLFRPELAPGS